MSLIIRTFVVLLLVVNLNGCAILSAYSLASLAVNGLSFTLTGKSLSDHALSSALHGDCAIWRLVQGDKLCLVGEDEPTLLVAGTLDSGQPGGTKARTERRMERMQPVAEASNSRAANTSPDAGAPFGDPVPGSAPARSITSRSRVASGHGPGPARSRLKSATPVLASAIDLRHPDKPELYVVLGSFTVAGNAQRQRQDNPGATIAPALVDGVQYYRVVLGPFGDSISKLAHRPDSELRGAGRWPVWLCSDTLRAPPCGVTLALR